MNNHCLTKFYHSAHLVLATQYFSWCKSSPFRNNSDNSVTRKIKKKMQSENHVCFLPVKI
uniref:Uncharacterized protein n=1 Tax=Rhizophagus irregularis (strain DAOM 181602 / DAOM 197198 / MUCL 43194) TaxID=747089 RepID=U9SI65_RHIID